MQNDRGGGLEKHMPRKEKARATAVEKTPIIKSSKPGWGRSDGGVRKR